MRKGGGHTNGNMADPVWDTLSDTSPSQAWRARAALCLEWLAGQPLVAPAVGMTLGIVLDNTCEQK